MSSRNEENRVLRKLYSSPKRFYHNLDHAQEVWFNSFWMCEKLSIEKQAVIRAALWHDAIYIFGEKNNEERSANALLQLDPSAKESADLIRLTTINDHLSEDITFENNPKAAILLDSDLMSLSWNYSRFIEAQKKIGEEAGVSHNIVSGHAIFLEKFLSKKRIYRCPGSDEQEIASRENIARLIREYS